MGANQRSPCPPTRCSLDSLTLERLGWLAAGSLPSRSPGRERPKLLGKKPKQRSLFAFPGKSKVSIEAEEPVSPKVSCIGQVKASKGNRANTKHKDSKRIEQLKPQNSRNHRKWSYLLSTCHSLSDSSSRGPKLGGLAISRVGLPSCEAAISTEPETSSGTFLAKSLLLLEEYAERLRCADEKDVEILSPASVSKDEHAYLEQSAFRQDATAESGNVRALSSLNIAGYRMCDRETRFTPLCCQRYEEEIGPYTNVASSEQQKREISPGVLSMESCPHEDGEHLDPDDGLPLNTICDNDISLLAHTSEENASCMLDTASSSPVKEEGESAFGPTDISSNSAMQGMQLCSDCQSKEQDCKDIHPQNACDGDVDISDWQGQGFHEVAVHAHAFAPLTTPDFLQWNMLSIPKLSEEDLHCFLIDKETDSVWDFHKAKRSNSFSMQAAFILRDFGSLCKVDRREETPSGRLWSVSLNCANDRTKLCRSYSATSHRSVLTLHRCKSEPSKSY